MADADRATTKLTLKNNENKLTIGRCKAFVLIKWFVEVLDYSRDRTHEPVISERESFHFTEVYELRK